MFTIARFCQNGRKWGQTVLFCGTVHPQVCYLTIAAPIQILGCFSNNSCPVGVGAIRQRIEGGRDGG
jgi:hypothetical protein